MVILNILIGGSFITFIILFFIVMNQVKRLIEIKKRDLLFKHYNHIIDIFDKARETAYQKIFRENILAYASSGYRIEPENINKLQNEYVSVILTYCGPQIKNDLISIHGNFDSVVAFLASDLIVRIENDESLIINLKQQGNTPIGMGTHAEN